jgi:hypothetical protein
MGACARGCIFVRVACTSNCVIVNATNLGKTQGNTRRSKVAVERGGTGRGGVPSLLSERRGEGKEKRVYLNEVLNSRTNKSNVARRRSNSSSVPFHASRASLVLNIHHHLFHFRPIFYYFYQ